jgi:hypothetical protein
MRSWSFFIKSSAPMPVQSVPVQGNDDRRLARDVPVQGEPGNANDNQRERRLVASQSHGRAPTPLVHAPEPNNDQRANEGANVDADAPPLFRRASQNLAAAAMLLRGCPEPASSEERRVRQQLKALLEAAVAQQAESSASRQRSERGRAGAPSSHGPNPPPPQQQGHGGGVAAAASAVTSRLGPYRDAQNTIEARRRAESVDGNHDHHSRRDDDRVRRRRHDNDDDRERSWSPSQCGPRAFGRSIRDAKFPSCFWAPTNVPRYDGDTNPSVWLEDYQLACHAGGATGDLFVIKNLPLYLGDSTHTWLEHLLRDKIQDWTDQRWIFVGNFQGTYTRPGK